jgi:hypothetical protein
LVWLWKTLAAGESDPENAPGNAVGLRVAECFAIEPAFENRISHDVWFGFSCGKQEGRRKLSLLSLMSFSGAKVTFGQTSPLCIGGLTTMSMMPRIGSTVAPTTGHVALTVMILFKRQSCLLPFLFGRFSLL